MPIRTSFTAATMFAFASVVLLVVGQPVKAVTVSYESGVAMSKSVASWAALTGGSANNNFYESFGPLNDDRSPTHVISEQEAFGSLITNPILLLDYGHQGIVNARLIDGLSTGSSPAVTVVEHLQHDAFATLIDSAAQLVVGQR